MLMSKLLSQLSKGDNRFAALAIAVSAVPAILALILRLV